MISRLKYIERWALMKNNRQENLCEHSLEVSMIAHALAVIGNARLGKNLNAERAALIGMYHDVSEIITGDMPTPIKYANSQLKSAFREVENLANQQILNMLPEDLQAEYSPLILKEECDEYLWELVKAADKISALLKCIEESNSGNSEFRSAENSLKKIVNNIELEEVKIFMEIFIPAYGKTLDELKMH